MREPGAGTEPEGCGWVLGIDTCGPSGSVALGRMRTGSVEMVGQTALEGRTYSAKLVGAVRGLLAGAQIDLKQLHAIVVVNGPGSFTGVRVGVSAVKGLAEGLPIGVVVVSRLAVLAAKAQVDWVALDAHRDEVFLRYGLVGSEVMEILTSRDGLADLAAPDRVAVCDEAARSMLMTMWPEAEIVSTEIPTAADAIAGCLRTIQERKFVDIALLDGHYLRRSDAEIFGDK